MQKKVNSIFIIFLLLVCAWLEYRVSELERYREVDRQLINGIGVAVINLIQKQNEETY